MNAPSQFTPDWVVTHTDGVPWHNARVHRRWQHHTSQSFGRDSLGRLVTRCSCGAFGPAPWVRLDPWPSRIDRKMRALRSV